MGRLPQLAYCSQVWAQYLRQEQCRPTGRSSDEKNYHQRSQNLSSEESRGEAELFSLKIKMSEGSHDNNLQIQKKAARKRKEISPFPCLLRIGHLEIG